MADFINQPCDGVAREETRLEQVKMTAGRPIIHRNCQVAVVSLSAIEPAVF